MTKCDGTDFKDFRVTCIDGQFLTVKFWQLGKPLATRKGVQILFLAPVELVTWATGSTKDEVRQRALYAGTEVLKKALNPPATAKFRASIVVERHPDGVHSVITANVIGLW